MLNRKLPLLLAVAGAMASTGASSMEKTVAQPAAITGMISDWNSPEFETEYRSAKTGVPLGEACDFARFLTALVEGKHVGQKYVKKFSALAWCQSISLIVIDSKSSVEIELGVKGEKVCDAFFGDRKSPERTKEKSVKGRVCYKDRNDFLITSVPTTIKSGSNHFDE